MKTAKRHLKSGLAMLEIKISVTEYLVLTLSATCTKKISKRVKKCDKTWNHQITWQPNIKLLVTATKVICFWLPTKVTREVSTPSYLLYNHKRCSKGVQLCPWGTAIMWTIHRIIPLANRSPQKRVLVNLLQN